MALQIETISDVVVIAYTNDDLDAENSEQFSKEIAPHFQPGAKIVLDLTHLDFVDSSGLGAILACKRKLDSMNGAFKLCGIKETVHEILTLVRLSKIFDIYDTKENALNSF